MIKNCFKVPASSLQEKANKYAIDWCTSCLFNAINPAQTNKLMFAYIFINMARALDKTMYSFEVAGDDLIFVCKENLLKEWDNFCVANVKYKKSYYSFLPAILKTFLIDNCQDYEDRKFTVCIDQHTVKVRIH